MKEFQYPTNFMKQNRSRQGREWKWMGLLMSQQKLQIRQILLSSRSPPCHPLHPHRAAPRIWTWQSTHAGQEGQMSNGKRWLDWRKQSKRILVFGGIFHFGNTLSLKESVLFPQFFPHLFQGKRRSWNKVLLYGVWNNGPTFCLLFKIHSLLAQEKLNWHWHWQTAMVWCIPLFSVFPEQLFPFKIVFYIASNQLIC